MKQALQFFGLRPTKRAFFKGCSSKTEVLELPQMFNNFLWCFLTFGINSCRNNKNLPDETNYIGKGSNSSEKIITEARNAIPNQRVDPFDPIRFERNYISVLDNNDIMEAKKVAEDYYKNITTLYKDKIVTIRLDTEMNNFLWAAHSYGNDLNPDTERFPAGNLVVFYVDTTVEGMPSRGIALGRENVNAQWKVINEGL